MAYNPVTKTYDAMADLKAGGIGTLSAGVRVQLLGYNTPGDGGGGFFYWNNTSTAADDGGVIIKPDVVTGAGRWMRIGVYTEVDVRWYGAVGNNATINTDALNAAAAFIRSNTSIRYTMVFSAGIFRTGMVNMTGVFCVKGVNGRTTVTGQPGEDILYWKGVNEAGYIAVTDLYLTDLIINVDAAVDVRNSYNRIGFGGEVVGNCGIHLPSSLRVFLNNVRFNGVNGPASGPAFGNCGIFGAGALYGLNLGSAVIVRSVDYGIIVGTSETYAAIRPTRIASIDGATGTFTAANSYTNGTRVAVIFDINDGSLGILQPRTTVYFIVNATAASFQLAAAAGGVPLTFTVTGSPTVFTVPAGSNAVEYANDEWAWNQLTTVTKRCGLSVANLAYSQLGTWACQSNYVAIRILNYQSANRNTSLSSHFDEMYTEGPLYTDIMVNKEYVRIEGERTTFINGPVCNTNAALKNRIVISGSENRFFNLGVRNNNLVVTGSRNRIEVKADGGEADISDQGQDNRIWIKRKSSGSATGTSLSLVSRSFNREFGGYWPDAILRGLADTPYQSDGVLFHVATQQLFNGAPAISLLYDDTTLEVPGYVRKTASGALSVRNPLGNNSNVISIGRYFPKGRWKLYAKVRSVAVQNITLSTQTVTGTGVAYSGVFSVGTSWQTIFIDCDHSAATADLTIQLNVSGASGPFDLAYLVVAPLIGPAVLGWGARNGSRFLRDDGVWADIPVAMPAAGIPAAAMLTAAAMPATMPAGAAAMLPAATSPANTGVIPLADFYKNAGNTSTTPEKYTTLYNFTLPANQLAATGQKIVALYSGRYAANNHGKRLQLSVNGAGCGIVTAFTKKGKWSLQVLMIRTGARTARVMLTAAATGAVIRTNLAKLDFTKPIRLELSGTSDAGAANDVVAEMGTIKWEAAALQYT